MSYMSVEEIEERISRLPVNDQLRLIERLAHRLRERKRDDIDQELAAMANDPNIQRELQEIESEFAGTESDGLEKH
jgi:uncharacterized protein YicC (UPF0701 family)